MVPDPELPQLVAGLRLLPRGGGARRLELAARSCSSGHGVWRLAPGVGDLLPGTAQGAALIGAEAKGAGCCRSIMEGLLLVSTEQEKEATCFVPLWALAPGFIPQDCLKAPQTGGLKQLKSMVSPFCVPEV